MKSLRDASDRSGRSLLLATAASVASMMISVYLEEFTEWRPANPMIHPVMATVAASMTFWVTWPRRNLLKLWLFMPIAFAVISIVLFLIGMPDALPESLHNTLDCSETS